MISAAKMVVSVSDWMSYVVLRGRWCNIIVLNVHAPTEEKSDDSKAGLYEEFESSFHAITCWSNLPVLDNS